jgi:hypothetical protein
VSSHRPVTTQSRVRPSVLQGGTTVKRSITVLLSVLMVLTAAYPTGSVFAQDTSADPNYGTLSLSAGFQPDPRVVSLTAGGGISASSASSGCPGYIANAPDVRLYYTSGAFPLKILVDSAADTTLVVNAPNGRWYCDDDSGNGSNPLLAFSSPQSGRYEIWVGTYSNSGYASADLYISERSSQSGSDINRALPAPEECDDDWYNPVDWFDLC